MASEKIIFLTTLIILSNFISAADFPISEKPKDEIEITITSFDGPEKTLDSEEPGLFIIAKDIESDPPESSTRKKIPDIELEIDEDNGCCQSLWQLIEKGLSSLGTARGATGIACFTGITQGALNFGWAFNWAAHAGLDSETSMKAQEICGIISAVEILLLGALFPYMMHKYAQNTAAEAAKKDD